MTDIPQSASRRRIGPEDGWGAKLPSMGTPRTSTTTFSPPIISRDVPSTSTHLNNSSPSLDITVFKGEKAPSDYGSKVILADVNFYTSHAVLPILAFIAVTSVVAAFVQVSKRKRSEWVRIAISDTTRVLLTILLAFQFIQVLAIFCDVSVSPILQRWCLQEVAIRTRLIAYPAVRVATNCVCTLLIILTVHHAFQLKDVGRSLPKNQIIRFGETENEAQDSTSRRMPGIVLFGSLVLLFVIICLTLPIAFVYKLQTNVTSTPTSQLISSPDDQCPEPFVKIQYTPFFLKHAWYQTYFTYGYKVTFNLGLPLLLALALLNLMKRSCLENWSWCPMSDRNGAKFVTVYGLIFVGTGALPYGVCRLLLNDKSGVVIPPIDYDDEKPHPDVLIRREQLKQLFVTYAEVGFLIHVSMLIPVLICSRVLHLKRVKKTEKDIFQAKPQCAPTDQTQPGILYCNKGEDFSILPKRPASLYANAAACNQLAELSEVTNFDGMVTNYQRPHSFHEKIMRTSISSIESTKDFDAPTTIKKKVTIQQNANKIKLISPTEEYVDDTHEIDFLKENDVWEQVDTQESRDGGLLVIYPGSNNHPTYTDAQSLARVLNKGNEFEGGFKLEKLPSISTIEETNSKQATLSSSATTSSLDSQCFITDTNTARAHTSTQRNHEMLIVSDFVTTV